MHQFSLLQFTLTKLYDGVLTWKTCCSFHNKQRVILVHCGQNPSCNFICAEDEGYTYEKAITSWRCTEMPHPRCDEHHKLAKMCVVKNLMNVNYGRPFFVCGQKAKPCSFWMWGDVQPLAKPECRHGLPCAIRKVKKGLNKDRLFFCCPNDKRVRVGFSSGHLTKNWDVSKR